MRRIATGLLFFLALVSAAAPALAHPHIWVTTRARLLFDGEGRVSGIGHEWAFDEGYSAHATQGMLADGKLDPAKATELAKLNVDSLADNGFFTTLRSGGARQPFGEPRDASVSLDRQGLLILSFVLPLKAPLATKRILFDVFDPTYFVDFAIAPGDAVTLAGAPAGCVAEIQRPKTQPASTGGQPLSETFFNALNASANFGAQFAGRVAVTCP